MDPWINDDIISLEEAVCGDKAIMIIEGGFGFPKRTWTKMTPMRWSDSRVILASGKGCLYFFLITYLP